MFEIAAEKGGKVHKTELESGILQTAVPKGGLRQGTRVKPLAAEIDVFKTHAAAVEVENTVGLAQIIQDGTFHLLPVLTVLKTCPGIEDREIGTAFVGTVLKGVHTARVYESADIEHPGCSG